MASSVPASHSSTPAGAGAAAPSADDLLAEALLRMRQHRDEEARPLARAALAASPQRADGWTLLGILAQRAGDAAEAEAAYREALRLRPDYANAWTNLGNLLRDRGDRRGALSAFGHAMRLAPGQVEPVYNLGVALEHFGDWAGSLAAFDAAVACAPAHVDARWNRALGLLRHGRFEEGFSDYEARFERGTPGPRRCAQPVWDGRPLGGRTLLVWAEQGFGDALQFLRFVPAAAARGARVVLEVTDGLQGLAARIPGVAAVTLRGAEPPPFDAHVALMSLPKVLGLTTADVLSCARRPYLLANAEDVARWHGRLQARGWRPERELAVGLVWATHPALRNAAERSPGWLALQGLLAAPDVRWFGLQKGPGHAQLADAPPGPNFVDLDADIADFDDTAAIIANLDLVVTCDTAVAHLAGAMGRIAFVLLPFTPDWRHGLNERSTPWYPSLRLWRQPTRGDWLTGLAQIGAAVASAVAPALAARGGAA